MSEHNKGYLCSQSGFKYEKRVFKTISNLMVNNYKLTSQLEKNLGKSTNSIDLICNYQNQPSIGIEIKKNNSPDWMQCSLKYNLSQKNWEGSSRSKIPLESRAIFNKLLDGSVIFNNQIPLFVQKSIKHEEWIDIKKSTSNFRDVYINIPNTTIRDIYRQKGCYYIQVSNKGLYHLGKDIYKFDVPEFLTEQQMRVRIKIHNRINSRGYCDMSVMAACQPKNIDLLAISKYSLDAYYRLPKKLLFRI
jgi:hypothetical protein